MSAIVIYVKQVKRYGADGYTVRDRNHCPKGELICIDASGAIKCDYMEAPAVIKDIRPGISLLTCTPPRELNADTIESE